MIPRAGIADIDRQLPRLFRYALALTADRHEAEDLTHDCLARALRAASPPKAGAVTAWLFTILRNLHIDARRRAARRPTVPYDDQVGTTRHDTPVIDTIALDEALRSLSLAHRRVLVLIDVQGCSYAEAARLLDVSPGTVMSRIARARAALLRLLAEEP